MHTECKRGHSRFRRSNYCVSCITTGDITKYNPFFEILEEHTENHDKNFTVESEEGESHETHSRASDILETCKNISIGSFNDFIGNNKHSHHDNFLDMHFLNIDGNFSNFDKFTVLTRALNHKFAVIGLAETNTDPINSDIYKIDCYSSIYQNRMNGKKKGSGVALYINNNYKFQKVEKFSMLNKNVETIFAEICYNNEIAYVGVIYRPPSGDLDEFHRIFGDLLTDLSELKNVFLMGDFNINLFDTNYHANAFNENIMCNGFYPLISNTTHAKPNCKQSCIDNIITNNIEIVRNSYTLLSDISHHRSLILSTVTHKVHLPTNRLKPPQLSISYDFNNKNLEKLSIMLSTELYQSANKVPENFDELTYLINNCIDSTCKLQKPKFT